VHRPSPKILDSKLCLSTSQRSMSAGTASDGVPFDAWQVLISRPRPMRSR
jgi:hypothetical protein